MTTSNDGTDAATRVTASGAGSVAASTAAPARTVSPAVGATPIVAGVGTASAVGRLSVPVSWSTAAPAVTADI
ncbi:PPE family protein, SVP subgroup, partial [Mycobacterium kansasii]